MPCCRTCAKTDKPRTNARGKTTPGENTRVRYCSAAHSGPEHRYFTDCLCLHCRISIMGILRVTFQSLQKPAAKKTSKRNYKK